MRYDILFNAFMEMLQGTESSVNEECVGFIVRCLECVALDTALVSSLFMHTACPVWEALEHPHMDLNSVLNVSPAKQYMKKLIE